MINASTFEKLKALNCSAMADEFQSQINDSKSYNLLGFEERLGLLVDAECVYYGKNVPLFRRNGYRKSGSIIP